MQSNILVLTHWSYNDALIQTYTLPYVAFIRKALPLNYKIILVTSEQQRHALSQKDVDRINAEWKAGNMQLIALPYQRFGVKKIASTFKDLFGLYRLVNKEKIKTIHAFCTPAGSIAYFLSRLTGAKLVIDSYEPHAEAMVENETWKESGLAYKMLHLFEKWQTKRATTLIATTQGMKSYAKKRFDVDVHSFFVKPACVNLQKFYPRDKDESLLASLGLKDKMVCVYAGKLGGIYLKEEVFDMIRCFYDHWKDDFRFLMLTNASDEEVENEIRRVGIPREAVINKFVKHEEVADYLSLGDFAINPVKPVPTKRYCTSIKDGEYWAMGLPVIITPNISDDSDIIEANEIGYVLKELTEQEYVNAIRKMEIILAQDKVSLQQKIRSIAERYRTFTIAESIYSSIYN